MILKYRRCAIIREWCQCMVETSAHNILGKIGHGHDDHHGVTEDHIEQSKALLKKHKTTILDRIKSILAGIKGLSTAIYKLTIGLLDRVIIWFCRNVLMLNVTSSAKAGQVVLLIIGIICSLYAAVFVIPASVAALSAGGLWNILSTFIPFITKGGLLMNKRIQEIAEQATKDKWKLNRYMGDPVFDGREIDTEKFAELIVQDCLGVLKRRFMGDLNREDMEVKRCIEDVKQHFGVEE